MTVDIYIREKSGTREIRIPLLPEEISFNSGDATVITHEIMDLGEVVIPSGTELDGWSWKSEFPGPQRKNDPMMRGPWNTTAHYDGILNDWKKNGTELVLLVLGYPINADVYLTEYHATGAGAFGDISYEVKFIEARNIAITTTTAEQATTSRPAATSSTYTIKSGDTLWGISQNVYGTGTKWSTIYDANKDIIEQTAKAHGLQSSDNGHWIYPGVTLTIPGVEGTGAASSSPTTTTTTETESQSSAKITSSYLAERNQTITDWVTNLYDDWKFNG